MSLFSLEIGNMSRMQSAIEEHEDSLPDEDYLVPKRKDVVKRNIVDKIPDIELIKLFWASPDQALFSPETIAAVTLRSVKTLECDRTRKIGVNYLKMGGKVLYRKSDVVAFLNSFESIVCSQIVEED